MVKYLHFEYIDFLDVVLTFSCIHSKIIKLFQNYLPVVTDITSFGQRLGSSSGHTRNFCPHLVLYRFKSMFQKESLT